MVELKPVVRREREDGSARPMIRSFLGLNPDPRLVMKKKRGGHRCGSKLRNLTDIMTRSLDL